MSNQPEAEVDNAPLAAALLGVIGVALGLHGAVYVSTAFSGSTYRGSLSDTVASALKMPSHLSHPGAAWSPSIALNPVVFYLSFLVVVALTTAGVWAAWRAFGGNGTHREFSVAPNAGLARVRDLSKLRVRSSVPGRITLGRVGRHLIAAEHQASLAVVGPTGCGKTAGFAIPAILEWEGPIIATSVKADLIEATISHRRSKGKVWIYDPTSCSGYEPATWSPIAACTTWSGAQRVASWMCEAAQPSLDSVSDGDYWYTQAKKALAPYLYVAAISERTMLDVVVWIDTQQKDVIEKELRRVASIDSEVDRRLSTSEGVALRKSARKKCKRSAIAEMRQWFLSTDDQFDEFADRPVSEWPPLFKKQLDKRLTGFHPSPMNREVAPAFTNT